MFLTSTRLPVLHAFSTREGGVSRGPFATLNLGRSVEDAPADVAENARRFACALDLSPGQLASVNQVHGDRILEVESAGVGDALPPALGDADGLVTRTKGVALTIRTADCVPVLLWAPDIGAIAAVHAGWRGALLGIAGKAVLRMSEWGADPARTQVAVGPSIRACCYQVGADVARQFEERWGPGLTVASRLDLPEAVRRSLAEVGVGRDQVEVLNHCTHCEPGQFFSHRRDHGISGRHVSLIALT